MNSRKRKPSSPLHYSNPKRKKIDQKHLSESTHGRTVSLRSGKSVNVSNVSHNAEKRRRVVNDESETKTGRASSPSSSPLKPKTLH